MLDRTRFKFIVYILLLAIAISLLAWWSIYSSAKSRDYERLADMKNLEAELINYYYHYNTFEVPECLSGDDSKTLINFCQGKGDRTLNVSNIIDPINFGSYQYVVNYLSLDNFSVSFAFETGIGGLPSGAYVLTREGITK
ncbi:MAG TPA: hypothetical protein VJB67_03030 [Patescibacteria group bacterium]|nr:hypothetical protein [Patescibacteria group bacterium]